MFSSGEYTNAYASPYTDYTHLDEYYKGSQFGPKIPATVPSMAYPTLLEQGNPYGYDVLTHDTDGNNYYNVEKAYGSSCQPKYYVAKCPDNNFLRPFVPENPRFHDAPTPCPVKNEPVSEGYTPPPDVVEHLRALEVVFFYDGSGRCKPSLDAIKAYERQLGGVSLQTVFLALKDIQHYHHKRELTDFGGTATPFFFSRKTGHSITGFVPTLEEIIRGLSGHVKESFQHGDVHNRLRNLDITIYVMRGCVFCDKLKKLLEDAKAAHLVHFADAHDPKHQKDILHVQGFPHYKSAKTGRSSTGYPGSLEKLISNVE